MLITSSRISFSVISILLASSTLAGAQAAEVTFSESSRGLILRTEQGAEDAEKKDAPVEQTSPTAAETSVQQPTRKLTLRPPPQPQVTLSRIVFTGNTVVSDDDLGKLSAPYLNRPLRFSDLEQLRVEITRAYTDAGYINSGAVLPDQQVTGGELTYQVVEGRLDNIEVSGTRRLKPAYVEKRVRAAAGEPFNSVKLQESFQLLLDDPLIERMDGQLLPLPEAGATGLNLKVTPSAPLLLNLTADNHGTPSVGSEQLTLSGTYLNPTGYGDSADLFLSLTPGRYNISGAYSVPLNVKDTRFAVDFGATNSTVVEEPLDDIDIDSESNSFGVSLSHPLRRNLQGSARLGVDLTIRDNSNTLLGQPFSFSAGEENGDSRVSALRLWQDYTRRGTGQVIALRSSFNFGVDAFGSTIHDDDRPDSDFFAWLGQAQYVRSVQELFTVPRMRVSGRSLLLSIMVSEEIVVPVMTIAIHCHR